MKTKNLTLIACCLVLASCTTTGDPTTGGIFWSRTKAMERQNMLLSELGANQAELKQEQRTTSNLVAKRNKLKAELEAIKAQLEQAQREGSTDVAALRAEKARLERELAFLR